MAEIKRVVFKKCNPGRSLLRGQWTIWQGSSNATGRVLIACPRCGMVARLDHEIVDNGDVSPSLVCANDGCTFHEWGTLEGWAESDG